MIFSPALSLYFIFVKNLLFTWKIAYIHHLSWLDLKGLWQWCMLYRIHRIFLDFFHHPVFQKTQRFGNWICFSPQVKVSSPPPSPEDGTDPVSETSCFLEYRTMEKVQKNSVNSVHHLSWTAKLGSPSCEQNMLSAAEHALRDTWLMKEAIKYTVCPLRAYCSCKQLTAIWISSLCVFILVKYSELCFMFSFTVMNWNGDVYTWTLGFLLYHAYVKNISYNLCKRGFCHMYLVFKF
jgi:hypothetical protein